jgi:hypothetical protein
MGKSTTTNPNVTVTKKLYWSMVGKGVDHVKMSAIEPNVGPYVIDLVKVSDTIEVHTLERMTVGGIKDMKKKVTVKLGDKVTTKNVPQNTKSKLDEANDKGVVKKIVEKMLGDAIKQAKKIKP